jgi:TRAP-type uncharacterized transport system substrate-binding protein
MKKSILFLICIYLVLIFAGFSYAEADQQVIDIAYLGGTWGEIIAYPLGTSDIINEFIPGIRTSVVKSVGAEMNTIMAADMAPNSVMYHTCSMDFVGSWYGVEPWEESYQNQRLLVGFTPGAMTFVGTIEGAELKDYVGRTISVLPLPSLQLGWINNMLDILGLTGQIEVVQLDFGPKEDALRDGVTDGLMANIYGPAGYETLGPGLEEVLYAKKNQLYWIQLDKEVVAEAASKLKAGFGVREVRPDEILPEETRSTYAETLIFSNIAVRADMDEDIAYKITKAILEHTDMYADYTPNGKYVTPELIANSLGYATQEMIHPGSIKALKEAGVWDTYLEARKGFVADVGEYE